MNPDTKTARPVRCAIYTRKSTDEGLEKDFNSLDAQRESAEAYIKSQQHAGWELVPAHYDDGGFTGGNMDRPGVKRLMADIGARQIDCVVVYKVDRLSRSLLDFARMMETFDRHKIAFVSVTQQFNTASSMGRLILNVLLSFAQFEREMISERTRDKMAATRKKGKWTGGTPILGYDLVDSKLVINEAESIQVQTLFDSYLKYEGLLPVVQALEARGWTQKRWITRAGKVRGGKPFTKTGVHQLLTNVTYIGQTSYKNEIYPGQHAPLIDEAIWLKAQTLLQAHGRLANAKRRAPYHALLQGLLRCAACNCAMTPGHSTRGGKRYRYYICSLAQKRGRATCPGRALPAGELERFIMEQVQQRLDVTEFSMALLPERVDQIEYDGRDESLSIRLRTVAETIGVTP